MDEPLFPTLPLLTPIEQSCLSRYVGLLDGTLKHNLLRVVVFGSVARAESRPRGMPIPSDLDLLVVHSQLSPKRLFRCFSIRHFRSTWSLVAR